ncbi:HNH endonuclease [Butyrivibrio sp. INlla14]|nr:HNH endonuclease [Butyrivibrio sp. INlla14]
MDEASWNSSPKYAPNKLKESGGAYIEKFSVQKIKNRHKQTQGDQAMRGIKSHKLQLKDRILAKTGGVCAACGKQLERQKVTIDHFVPKYHGGTDDERNLLPLCRNCNKHKGSRLVNAEEYYHYLEDKYCAMASEYKKETGKLVNKF